MFFEMKQKLLGKTIATTPLWIFITVKYRIPAKHLQNMSPIHLEACASLHIKLLNILFAH